jgi:cation/acetate symporter
MTFNFIVSLVVSKFTPAPPLDVQEIVENIRIPREIRAAKKTELAGS